MNKKNIFLLISCISLFNAMHCMDHVFDDMSTHDEPTTEPQLLSPSPGHSRTQSENSFPSRPATLAADILNDDLLEYQPLSHEPLPTRMPHDHPVIGYDQYTDESAINALFVHRPPTETQSERGMHRRSRKMQSERDTRTRSRDTQSEHCMRRPSRDTLSEAASEYSCVTRSSMAYDVSLAGYTEPTLYTSQQAPSPFAQVGTALSSSTAAVTRWVSKRKYPETWLAISGLNEKEARETRQRYHLIKIAIQEKRIPDDIELEKARERASIGAKATLHLIKEMRAVFDGPTIHTRNNKQALELLLASVQIAHTQKKQIPELIRASASSMRNVVRTELKKSDTFFKENETKYAKELTLSDDEKEKSDSDDEQEGSNY